MSENLFNFPGGTPSEVGADPFDLGGLTELTGSDPENPFADMMDTSVPAAATPPVEYRETTQSATVQTGIPQTEQTPQPAQSVQPVKQTQSIRQEAAAPLAHAPKTPEPKTPPAADDADGEDMANPLLAAMDQQEAQNARKAAEPIFAQLPVFSYNGTTEPIENTEQTFEELRLAKADDFPEFDEAQNLKWKVTYGKITKEVPVPRKTKIGQFKREIESSKDFMNALKKAADKNPKCLVQPVINMQKKGEACIYKGAFLHLSDARASEKTISFIPGQNGKVYERRTTDAGEFITPTDNITILDNIRPGFQSALPRVPYGLISQVISLFRALMAAGHGGHPLEALVHIYWDKQEQRYFVHVPKQFVSKASVNAVLDDEDLLDGERYIHYADLHSHNRMPAVFSKIDDRDERATRVYMVIGRLDRYFPEVTVRICNGGRFLEVAAEQVLEMPPVGSFPEQWLERIYTQADEGWETAA